MMVPTGVSAHRRRVSIGTKLFAAFGISAMLTIVAAGTAIIAFTGAGETLERVTKEGIPSIHDALSLTAHVKDIAAASPMLANSRDQGEREVRRRNIDDGVVKMKSYLTAMEQFMVDPKELTAATGIADEIARQITDLDAAILRRLELKKQREQMTADILKAHDRFLKVILPLADSINFDMMMKGESIDVNDKKAIAKLLDTDVGILRAVTELQAQGNLVAGLLVSAANSTEMDFLVPQKDRFVSATASINGLLAKTKGLEEGASVRDATLKLVDFGHGQTSVFTLRHDELEMGRRAEVIVVSNIVLADRINESAERLAEAANSKIDGFAAATQVNISQGRGVILVVAIVAVAAAALLGWLLVGRNVVARMKVLAEAIHLVAQGNHKAVVPIGGNDEITDIACALDIFRKNALKMEEMQQGQLNAEARQKDSEKKLMASIADDLENKVKHVVTTILDGSRQIIATAENMGKRIDVTTSRSFDVASAAERTSANVQTVSFAAQGLSSAIIEIGRQTTHLSTVAGGAVSEAQQTNRIVEDLSAATNEINEVVVLIGNVAAQTNLLALNATIEAARAGDAGKGFAVVASEVKNLANQTSQATERIRAQIMRVQSSSSEAADAIQKITGTIGTINGISTAIANAVTQQEQAATEINTGVHSVSADADTVLSNVTEATRSSASSYGSAIQVLWVAKDLSGPVTTLDHEVDAFLRTIRS